MADKKTMSEITAAAGELEDALASFERTTTAAGRVTLGSQRNVEKAAQAVTDAAAVQPLIAAGIQRMLAALNAARERNERAAEELRGFGERVRERSEVCAGLLGRFGELGEEGRATNAAVQALGAAVELTRAEKIARLGEIEQRMVALIDRAQGLVKDAQEAAFGDIAGQADSMRQQILSARNKVSLLARKLPS